MFIFLTKDIDIFVTDLDEAKQHLTVFYLTVLIYLSTSRIDKCGYHGISEGLPQPLKDY